VDGARAVTGYFRRLIRALGAYQVADVVSKFIAIILLPIYSRYIPPSGYGLVTILTNGGILISIVVRFGIIEAFLRYYYVDDDQAPRRCRSCCSPITTPPTCASPTSACGRSRTSSSPTGCCAWRSGCGHSLSSRSATWR
jgi:hypothetical protein